MAFHDRLRQARERAELTQAQVASLLGIAKSTYNGYETGKSEPSMNAIANIMRILNASPGFLWQDEMPATKGDALNAVENNLLNMYRQLNEEGQEKLLDYADDLLQSGKYIKSDTSRLVSEAK